MNANELMTVMINFLLNLFSLAVSTSDSNSFAFCSTTNAETISTKINIIRPKIIAPKYQINTVIIT